MRGGRRGGSVVQPLHRNNLITPTRCDPMMAASSRDWNVFKQIFADHWEPFQQAHPHYQTAYYDSLVAKMLACGNPEKIGVRRDSQLHIATQVAWKSKECSRGQPLHPTSKGQGEHSMAAKRKAKRRRRNRRPARPAWYGENCIV